MIGLLLALQTSPCDGAAFGPGTECRVLLVAENPERPGGRKIPIRYVVYPATGSPKAPEPVLLFAGGPGAPGTGQGGMVTGLLGQVRQTRDVVLVDQRGTGGSNPLMCDAELRNYPARAFGHVFDPGFIEACRKGHALRVDLRYYTTEHAIQDIEEVRRALAAGQMILWGGSFGTRIAQSYARRYPARVKAMVLDGVVPFDMKIPLSYAATLQQAVDRYLGACRARPSCRDSFPALDQQWAALVERLRREQAPVTITGQNGREVQLRMHLGDFGYAVRGILYRGDQSRELPAMIAKAATSGDLSPFAQRYYSRAADFEEDFADGLHLATLCSEETAFIQDQEIAPAIEGAFIRSYLIDDYRGACNGWPRAKLPPDLHEPLRAPIPTLLTSGYYDPVTPPEMAERVAAHLPVHRHIVTSNGHHGTSFGCARPATLFVLTNGTIEGIPDVRC